MNLVTGTTWLPYSNAMTLIEKSEFLSRTMVESEGHIFPTEYTIEALKTIYKHTDAKSVLEIGFNAGHSAFTVLSLFDYVTYHSVDIAQYEHTEINAAALSDMFPERFSFEKINSQHLDTEVLSRYDMVFVDGDHSVEGASMDLQKCNEAGVKWILVDDYQYIWLRRLTDLIDHYIASEKFPYHLVGVYRYETFDGVTKRNKMVLLGRDE